MSSNQIISLEKMFDSQGIHPVIINDHPPVTKEEKDSYTASMLTVYDSDTLQPCPQCSCGNLKGRFRLGDRCDICGDTVSEVFDKKSAEMWMIPLPKTPVFITPVVYTIMQKHMYWKSVDTLKYLIDPYYRVPNNRTIDDRIAFLFEQKGHERGLNYFYENFDKIIHDFVVYNGKNIIPEKLEKLREFLEYNRHLVFTTKLPVPNRVMFPIEKSGKSNYGDTGMLKLVDAIRLIQESEIRHESLNRKQQESRMAKVMELFSQFHFDYVKKTIGSKYGSARQHLFGGRWHFSSRAVIGSIYNPHDFLEVYFPWSVAMEQFYVQIVNKLIGRGKTLQQIDTIMREHATTYSKEIDEIFQELIDESPYIGLPIIFQRNPTIRRPSAEMVYVTKIKSNTNDNTISASMGNLTGKNADFDGDALNTAHLQDRVSHDNFKTLSPENNVMDLSDPWGISGNLKLQPPVVSTAANWILQGRRKAYGEK